MARRCKLCHSSKDSDANIILFRAPKEPSRRAKWSESCGVSMAKHSLICQNHFLASDFLGKELQQRLKSTAIPTPFHYCEPKLRSLDESLGKDPLGQNILQTEIKVEPPDDFSPLIEVNIKEEPKSSCDPEILIHEANFDASSSSPQETNSESQKTSAIESNQKSSSGGTSCGRIERKGDKDAKIFLLICNECNKEFEITKGEDFVKHTEEHEEKPKPNEILENTKTSSNDCDEKLEKERNDDDENMNEDSNDSERSEDESEEETYEPKAKKIKRAKRTKGEKDRFITFTTRNKQCVIDLLDLVKSNAVLWHRRQLIKKRFDESLSAVTLIFNFKWPNCQMTEEKLHMSIRRMNYMYKRITDPNHKAHTKNSILQKKFPEYFKICDEIEENSKKMIKSCDHCFNFFFDEIDLQIHKVKLHRIGELPYICKICHYGYSDPKKLAEHEKKHERRRDFSCEICQKTFTTEKFLQNHAVVHDKKLCELCGKSFSSQTNYRLHQIYHEKPTCKCKICEKLFYFKRDLSEHMKTHRNERLYACYLCGKSFNHQRGLNIHIRGVHKNKISTSVNNSWSDDCESSPDMDDSTIPLELVQPLMAIKKDESCYGYGFD